jgi:hypothetical protein
VRPVVYLAHQANGVRPGGHVRGFAGWVNQLHPGGNPLGSFEVFSRSPLRTGWCVNRSFWMS